MVALVYAALIYPKSPDFKCETLGQTFADNHMGGYRTFVGSGISDNKYAVVMYLNYDTRQFKLIGIDNDESDPGTCTLLMGDEWQFAIETL